MLYTLPQFRYLVGYSSPIPVTRVIKGLNMLKAESQQHQHQHQPLSEEQLRKKKEQQEDQR